ncbi:protein kinase family protein [Aspergillus affinis]|uniref:protein kinase family protein n=1 Tax=Aspergillus affinis TaxID=1070780 RepID=UPI0022FECF9F|nr:kinase domain-containing protein [Aspergillus affinis]KAI9041587.1 kinase domain-containing protein [Aspergillus affinis]
MDDGTALKSPFPDSEIESHVLDIAKEAAIYHRIGPHKRFVQLLGHSRDGLLLEYMGSGDLKAYLQTHGSIPTNLKLKWAYQAAEAVELLHRNGVIHCDVKPRNFLLDAALDIKIIDFSVVARRVEARIWRGDPILPSTALGRSAHSGYGSVRPWINLVRAYSRH